MWTLASTRQPALYKAWPSPKVCPSVVSCTHSLQTDPHLSKQLISLHAIASFHVSHHLAYFSPQPRTLLVPYLSFICCHLLCLIATSPSSLHPRARLPDCTLSSPPKKDIKGSPTSEISPVYSSPRCRWRLHITPGKEFHTAETHVSMPIVRCHPAVWKTQLPSLLPV